MTRGPAETPERSQAGTCPICGKPATRQYRPFCSRRCADLDLGRWLSGRYAVPGERVEPGSEGRTDDESEE